MLADAVPPGPASFEVTLLVMLVFNPSVVPVTFTEKVQRALDVKVDPNRLTAADPAVDVMPPPPQEPVSPFGAATTKPAGKVSVKPTPVSDAPKFGLVRVKLRLVAPFSGMLAAPKTLVIVGGDKLGVPPQTET